MSSLSCITRASSSPRGKPRVWFCCHPDDQARFLEPVSKDLLAAADCAVWYDPDPAARLSEEEQAEREAALADMQLFVMPVTSRLLTVPSPALAWQFPLAQRLHIPVLPLLQEPGLEALFNEKCGELQCLDPNQSDPTALPYPEKLKKYLEGVLVGDELAAKVRAAFDAYIFLSYRKKDRRQAQALMQLIHQNDFCRDIAIWYDEFLTPGEDFNAAIAQALDKSRLFVLAVTPNLLEKPNYVMEEEFPRARDGGKAILPVEMAPTDRAGLEAAYPGIPACAGAATLPAGLQAALRGLALRENDADPAHTYFIGLAYLAGIDVEVDKERGAYLIRDAARRGLPEAMEKLVAMYRTGEGVARDYVAAARWQRLLADERRGAWESRRDEEHFLAYANALWELGDQYSNLGEPAAARRLWEGEFLPLADQGREKKIFSARRYTLVGYGQLGFLCQAEGDLTTAHHWFEKSLRYSQSLADETTSLDVRRDQVVSLVQLGELYLQEENLDAARTCFNGSRKLIRILLMASDAVAFRRDLAVICGRLGFVCQKEGDLPSARDWYEESLNLHRALFEETGSSQAKRDLAVICSDLGAICREEGNMVAARHWFEEEAELTCALLYEAGTVEARRDRVISCQKLGTLFQQEGDLDAARSWFEKSLEVERSLAPETNIPETRQAFAANCARLGNLCKTAGDLASAQKWLEESLALRRTLAAELKTVQAWDELATSLCMLGLLPNSDKDLFLEAGEIWNSLSREFHSCPDFSQKHILACRAYSLRSPFGRFLNSLLRKRSNKRKDPR